MAYKYYNQLRYPEIPYGSGTVSSSGCGLCACCMVVENLTGQSFTPAEAAQMATDCGAHDETGTEISILAPAVCEKYGLTYELTCDHGKMLQFLQNGEGLAVANSGGDREGWTGVFTRGGHFMTLVGAKGREIAVLDPSMTPDKYETPGRKGKVRVEGVDHQTALGRQEGQGPQAKALEGQRALPVDAEEQKLLDDPRQRRRKGPGAEEGPVILVPAADGAVEPQEHQGKDGDLIAKLPQIGVVPVGPVKDQEIKALEKHRRETELGRGAPPVPVPQTGKGADAAQEGKGRRHHPDGLAAPRGEEQKQSSRQEKEHAPRRQEGKAQLVGLCGREPVFFGKAQRPHGTAKQDHSRRRAHDGQRRAAGRSQSPVQPQNDPHREGEETLEQGKPFGRFHKNTDPHSRKEC